MHHKTDKKLPLLSNSKTLAWLRAVAKGLILAFVLASCSFFEPHKIPIQQGNLVNQKALKNVELGMSKEQVSYLLGTPLSVDAFDPDYWIYHYSIRRDEKLVKNQRIKLRFEDDQLATIETEGIPDFNTSDTEKSSAD